MKTQVDFKIRALEIHSLYAWDYNWILQVMDFMKMVDLNTIIFHRNDWIDLIIYPGKYFGYDQKEQDTIFETYSQIFRKLYQYTPTRRSGPYHRRTFFKRVLYQAQKRGIHVFVENKELYFPDIILEFFPHLVKDGHICATDPFWEEFLKVKYRDFLREFPEVDGVITAPGTGESRLSIKSNRCVCESCRNVKQGEWFDRILRAIYESVHREGKTFVVRDFAFNPQVHEELGKVMECLPDDVIISLKNTPHDYYPTFPDNTRIGQVGNHRQWVEYDAMGQYFGWGIAPADLSEDYRRRMSLAKKKGAEGIIIRTDWESLDGHTAFGTLNKLNIYSAAMLSVDLTCTKRAICERFLREGNWFKVQSPEQEQEAATIWFESLMSRTWEAVSGILYVLGCVFSDSSLLPVSSEHAFWLAEEKNSLAVWDLSKKEVLFPKKEQLKRALEEKKQSIDLVKKLRKIANTPPDCFCKEKAEWLKQQFEVFEEYAAMYEVGVRAILLTRYVKKAEEKDSFYTEKKLEQNSALKELKEWEEHLKYFGEHTDYIPHTIYTLMDSDRVRCLLKKLLEEIEK